MSGSGTAEADRRWHSPWWLGPLNVAVKVTVVALTAYGAYNDTQPEYAGKGMGERMILAPLAMCAVPAWWWIKGRPRPYPHVPDIFLAMPFVIDAVGLTLGLWGSTSWFDRVAHFVGWVGLTGAIGVYLSAFGITRRNTFLMAFGLGVVSHVLWEIFEYLSVLTGAFNLAADYFDTMDDLVVSLLASATGALLAATVLFDRGLVPEEMVTQDAVIVQGRRRLR